MTVPLSYRRLWLNVHLWLGLTIGVIFAVLGLTGSILAFYPELDRWLNPELVVEVPAESSAFQLQPVLEKLQATHPHRPDVWRLELPAHADYAITARYYNPEETAGQSFAPLMVAINPYTQQIINERFWGDYAVTWIYNLHYSLLLGSNGILLIAIIGLLLLVSITSGLILWWPSKQRLKSALKIRLRHGFARKVYDIHTLTAIYSSLLLLVIIVTGVMLAQPQWFTPLINQLSPLEQHPSPRVTERSEAFLSLDEIHKIAEAAFPNARMRWIQTPGDSDGVFFVRMQQAAEPGQRFPKSLLWINPYTGEILHKFDPTNVASGDTVMNWLHPLHNGEAFGVAGRSVIALSGLLPLVLLVSGYLRWRQKRRARHFRNQALVR
ncbi:PepSY-associated TM helix domain-containing protein [Methylophaga lonarensis]|uniref:PepSY-associated TM helix domain-containing protein n=1 Tax=Methylophaga lonarensis TaxID=999151 RepID=UPI000590BC3C|nr:PepSY-associated TM helix domain-containing protein [Methylophaga lonarensis]